jgi:hypothetical protein
VFTALQAAIYIELVARSGFGGSWSVGMMLGLSLLTLAAPASLPHCMRLLIVLAGTLNALAVWFDLFERLLWFDKFLHIYSTFAVVVGIGVSLRLNPESLRSVLRYGVLGLAIGCVWEFLEAIIVPQQLQDTIADLLCDIVGALIARHAIRWIDVPTARKRASDS